MKFWLLKTEPSTWSWNNQLKANIEKWDGVRNYQARNHMKDMSLGDLAFFYHTGDEKAIVGIVEIVKTHYPDSDENFCCVDVKTYQEIKQPVSLKAIKENPKLNHIPLVKHSRLSVMPINEVDFKEILKMAQTTLKT